MKSWKGYASRGKGGEEKGGEVWRGGGLAEVLNEAPHNRSLADYYAEDCN